MKDLIKKILREEVEEKVLEIPGLQYFGDTKSPDETLETWNRVLSYVGDRKFKIKGDLYLEDTPIKSLGNLQSVGGDLDLRYTLIKSLGNLQSVGGDLNLHRTPIEFLGNLQFVGSDLYLGYTPILKKYSEEEIRQMVNVEGNIYM